MTKGNIYEGILENSFAICLMLAMAGIIYMMMFASISFTNCQQMLAVMVSMYLLCRLYQKYRRGYEKEYSMLGGNNLGKLFTALTVLMMGLGFYLDICRVARW